MLAIGTMADADLVRIDLSLIPDRAAVTMSIDMHDAVLFVQKETRHQTPVNSQACSLALLNFQTRDGPP